MKILSKDIALIGIFTALLIGGQFALSGISGVEIVTLILTVFCFSFGIKRGLILVNIFILIRCFLFGFFPTVIIVYFIYYNIFTILVGFAGNKVKREYSVKNHCIILLLIMILTVFFTLLDDIITPLFYVFDFNSAKAYFVASMQTLLLQEICAFISVAFLFKPLIKCCKFFKK